jgi:hypothetical protein
MVKRNNGLPSCSGGQSRKDVSHGFEGKSRGNGMLHVNLREMRSTVNAIEENLDATVNSMRAW